MSAESQDRVTATDRVIAAVITPFVVGWDLFKSVVFAFFGLVERLDPFAAVWRLLKRFAPWVSRLWRAVLPNLIRLRDLLGRVVTRIERLVSPVTRRLSPLVTRAWRLIARIAKPVYAALRRTASEVRRVAQPALRTAARLWRTAAAPFRRIGQTVRRRVESVRARVAMVLTRRAGDRSG